MVEGDGQVQVLPHFYLAIVHTGFLGDSPYRKTQSVSGQKAYAPAPALSEHPHRREHDGSLKTLEPVRILLHCPEEEEPNKTGNSWGQSDKRAVLFASLRVGLD